ncbi:hypothetical protein P5673_014110, partial [Acropora cervicornis]
MAEAAGKAVLRKNCFLRSQHLLLSRMNMMEWVCRRVKGMENAQRITLLLV